MKSFKYCLFLACLLAVSLVGHAQSAVVGLPGANDVSIDGQHGAISFSGSGVSHTGTAYTFNGGGSSVTLEHVYGAPGSFTFAHNLASLFYQVHCITRVGAGYASATFSDTPVDTNDASITVPSAGDYICAFSAVNGTLSSNFSFAVSGIPTLYVPSLAASQTIPLTITQSASGGFTGSVTYSSTGLPSGMSTAYSPNPITGGSGTSALTVSFPYNQASGTNAFTAQGVGTATQTQPVSIPFATTNNGLVDAWASNEGSGTTYNNTTADGNAMTVSNGTWGATTGFPGNVAHYNGTTTVAVGTNFTNTNFDGTTPFSSCVWANATSVAPADQWLISTFDEGLAAVPGWGMELSVGAFRVYLINNLASNNYISVGATGGPVAVNTTHQFCMTYDGSRTAAGTLLYVDGTAAGLTVFTNALTGSIVSGLPARLGAAKNGAGITAPFGGSEGYVRVYNRVLTSGEISTLFGAGAI